MNPTTDKDVADQIAKLYDLHQSGVLSKSEFEQAKQRVLGGQASPNFSHDIARDLPQKQNKSFFQRLGQLLLLATIIFGGLVIGVVVLVAIFGGDNDGSSRNSASAPATTTTMPEEIMTGIVVLMGVANTDLPGESCYGVGDHAMFAEGEEVSVTAIGGHQDRPAWLSDGTVDRNGHCRMAFGVPWFDVDEYQFGFSDDLFVHCDRDTIVEIGENYTTQIRVAPNGAYCQAPAS